MKRKTKGIIFLVLGIIGIIIPLIPALIFIPMGLFLIYKKPKEKIRALRSKMTITILHWLWKTKKYLKQLNARKKEK